MADVAAETAPPSIVQTESFRSERPQIVGPDVPGPPFPIALSGAVQRGFGRGGKDLGCPTGLQICSLGRAKYGILCKSTAANLPDESLPAMSSVTKTGVYYGYAQIYSPEAEKTPLAEEDAKVFPMVMSLGWNPFYKNERMTAVR